MSVQPVRRKSVVIECNQCPTRAESTLLYCAQPDGWGHTLQMVPTGWCVVRGTYGPGSDPDDRRKWHRATQAWLCPRCRRGLLQQSEPADRAQTYVELMAAATDDYGVIWCRQPGCNNVADPAGLLHGRVACEPCIARHFERPEQY